jgi:BASS family bile acid:Na+ symporter
MSITRNIPVMILGAILFGFVWPMPGLWLKPYLIYLLMVMMFFSCLKIDVKELRDVPPNWWRYLVLLGLIFFVPSFIVFLARPWLTDMIFVGLIIAAAMPAGISIVFLSDLMGGEPLKALVVTTLTHILSPIFTPMVIWLFAHKIVDIEFGEMIILIGKLVIVPLILAQIVRQFRSYKKIVEIGSSLNLVLLFLLVWSSISLARAPIFSNISQFFIALAVVFVLLIVTVIFSVWFGRNRAEDITWAVSGTYKNFTLASVVALTMFGPVAMVGSAVYDVLDNILLVPIKWWATRSNYKK